MGVKRCPLGIGVPRRDVRRSLPRATSLAFLSLTLFCATVAAPANAGEICGGVAPACSGACLPGSGTCGSVAGGPCECLQTCGDFPACAGGTCPTGFVCSNGAADRPLTVPIVDGGIALEMTGLQFLRDWILPHFYFHVVTAYDILRANGAPLGKLDYMAHVGYAIRPLE